MSHFLGELFYQQSYNPNIPSTETPPPQPDKPSYIITMAPRVRALQEFYKLVKPNGNFEFDLYYNGQNTTQAQLIGMVGRLVRFKPIFVGKNYVPYLALFSNMNEAEEYLAKQKVKFERSSNRGNALVVMSKLDFYFPVKPTLTTMLTAHNKINVKALKFTTGFHVLQSQTVQQERIFQFPTTDPRVILTIFPSYQPPNGTVENQPVFDFLRFRERRYFYTDITYQFKSISIPQLNLTLNEDTKKLDGLYLLRVNYRTNNTNAIQIKNFIQYTKLKITQEGFSTESKTQNSLKETFQIKPIIHDENYAVNTSFMIWAEHLDIHAYPLFIGYINEKDFVKA